MYEFINSAIINKGNLEERDDCVTKEKTKKFEMDMCEGPVLKKMLIFALPLMVSSILQLLFNAADIIVVGRFAGDNSLAAVGSTTSLVNLLVNMFIGMSVGVNVLVARFYGAKREKDLSTTVHTAMAISVAGGVILTAIGMIGAPVLLELMQTPAEVINLAVVYLRTYFVGMIAMLIYNFGAAILRAIGDTQRPLFYLITAGVVNVSFNMVFVIVFHWGVFGVGLATTISQMISAGLIVCCLIKEQGIIHLDLKRIRIDGDKFKQILKIGLPAGLQGTLFSISNVMVQSSVNMFGATVVAGNSAAANIEGFIFSSTNAFTQAAISFTSQNYGAKKYDRINRIMFAAQGCSLTVGLTLGISAVLAGPLLLSFYTTSSAVVAAGMVRLKMLGVSYAVCGIMDTMVGSLRGLGYSVIPMIFSLLGSCATRLIWLATVFQIEKFHTIETVYIIYPISWLITAITHITTYIVVRKRIEKRERMRIKL